MLNFWKTKRALTQAKHHVDKVNRLNDELVEVGKEQNRTITEQQETIAALQKRLQDYENAASPEGDNRHAVNGNPL